MRPLLLLRALEDWHRLSLVRRGYDVHATTDPACRWHRRPRPGSLLDRRSRGVGCPLCVPIARRGPS